MALQGAGVRAMLLLFSTLSFIWLSLLLIFLSFLAVKIDGKVQWTWPQVMSPLFAIDGVVLLLLAVSVPQLLVTIRSALRGNRSGFLSSMASFDNEPSEDQHILIIGNIMQRAARVVLVYLESVLLVALTITVAVGLDSKDPGSLCWRAYLAPWYAWAGCYFVGALLTCRPPVTAERFARVGISGLSPQFLVAYGAAEALQGVCSVVFSVVCACRIDGVITTNWFVVGIPIYVAMGALQLRRVLERDALFTAALARDDVEEGNRGQPLRCSILVEAIFSGGVPLASFSIILSMLQGSTVKMAVALVPMFFYVSVLLLVGYGFVCGVLFPTKKGPRSRDVQPPTAPFENELPELPTREALSTDTPVLPIVSSPDD